MKNGVKKDSLDLSSSRTGTDTETELRNEGVLTVLVDYDFMPTRTRLLEDAHTGIREHPFSTRYVFVSDNCV